MRLHRGVGRTIALVCFCTLILLFSVPDIRAGNEAAAKRAWASLSGRTAEGAAGETIRFEFLRARYEIDVFGALATGKLVQEFRNNSVHTLPAIYALSGASTLNNRSVLVEVDGRRLEDHAADAADTVASPEPATSRNPPSAGNKKGAPVADGMRSKPIEVGPGREVRVVVEFQLDIPFAEGRSRLRLPAIFEAAVQIDRRAEARATTRGKVSEVVIEDRPPRAVPLSMTVNIHHDERLREIEGESHDILVTYEGDRTVVELTRLDIQDGNDIDMRFSFGSEYEATLLAHAGPDRDGARKVVVNLTPPGSSVTGSIRAKQVLFIMDTSGSMRNGKLDEARRAVTTCLHKMRQDDLYNIVEFDNRFTMLSAEPVKIAGVSPREAEIWLEQLEADGGTQLLPALRATFEQPPSSEHHRMVVVLTDGMMVDEEEVLEVLAQGLGEGRLFVVGIGGDVKRDTIRRLAQYGRGTAAFATEPEALEPVVAGLFDSVAAPLAWDLTIDWGGAVLEAMEPERLPDLYSGRPVRAVALVRGDLPEELSIHGLTSDGEQSWVAGINRIEGDALRKLPAPSKPAAPPIKKTLKPDEAP